MAEAAGERVWRAALGLVGTRFRLHGREPVHGLDCVGLVAAACRAAGVAVGEVPDRYRLRGETGEQVTRWIAAAGLVEAVGVRACGDVVLSALGFGQTHVVLIGRVTGGWGHVHAHAGLGRVVLMPGEPAGAVLGRWCVGCEEIGFARSHEGTKLCGDRAASFAGTGFDA